MSKLTVEDLVRQQEETQKQLARIADHVECLTKATRPTVNQVGPSNFWQFFMLIVWFACQFYPPANHSLTSFCIVIVVGILLDRRYMSPIDENPIGKVNAETKQPDPPQKPPEFITFYK